MSAYYDLFEKPDVRQTGEQQSLYARFVPKGTIDRKEFIERVHHFHRPQPQPAGRSDGRLYGRVARLPCQWLDGGAGRTGLLHPPL